MLGKKDVNMLSGSITKGLLIIAIPIMLMNVLISLFNILDMWVLKLYDTDGLSVGAVGACKTLITLITNLVIGIATGANVAVAKHIGRKDPQHAERAAGTAVVISVLAGLALTVIGISCAGVFLTWVNCPEQLMSRAVLYFQTYFAGVPFLMIYNFCTAILRATGNSKRIMFISLMGCVVKIAATYLFVAVFHMGILGVSLSTIVSWLFYVILSLYYLRQKNATVRIRRENLRMDKQEMVAILKIGVPTGLQMGMYAIANVVISAAVNAMGPEATTGISIANTYDGVLYNICVATSLAVMPYVSQNMGAHNVKRAVQSIWKGVWLTVCIGASFGALSALFSRPLASIMSDDEMVITFARQKMIIISSTYFICGINDIVCAALRGMGRSLSPTIATLVFMCILRFVWVYWIFPLLPNLTFLYFVWPIGWVLSIITLLFVLVPTVKMRKAEFAVE